MTVFLVVPNSIDNLIILKPFQNPRPMLPKLFPISSMREPMIFIFVVFIVVTNAIHLLLPKHADESVALSGGELTPALEETVTGDSTFVDAAGIHVDKSRIRTILLLPDKNIL